MFGSIMLVQAATTINDVSLRRGAWLHKGEHGAAFGAPGSKYFSKNGGPEPRLLMESNKLASRRKDVYQVRYRSNA